MKFNRRHFCSALAMGSAGIVGGTVSAQSEVQITGSISSAVGAEIEGVELVFQHVDTNSVWRYTVPANGDIALSVSETGEFRVRAFDTAARNDNVPVVYSFGRTTVDDTGATVSYTLPQSYAVTIQCVDDEGNPVGDLPILLRAGGTGHQPGLLTTTDQGYVTFAESKATADPPELQLAGPTSVEVSANNSSQRLGMIEVTESADYEFEVSNPEQYTPEVTLIEANPAAGFEYPYFLYAPDRDETESELPLLVEPNNTGTSTDDFSEHRIASRELLTRRRTRTIADELTVPALVPVFPRPTSQPVDWTHYTHQLDVETLEIDSGPLERIDQQLINMIEHARTSLNERGYTVTDDGVLLNGFSASGTFADRFTVLHPDEILSVTAGGLNGMVLLPMEEIDGKELPYHVGLANIEDLIGQSPDLEELDATRQFLYMGGEDENDTLPYDDAWTDDDLKQLAREVYGDDMIEDRFPRCESLYQQAGIQATFKIYEGVGHTPRPAMEDIISFHEQTVAEYRESEEAESTDSATDENSDQQTSGSSAPGFGIGSGIAALGAAGYMLSQRLTDDSD
jgi:hypothetical protein